MSEQRSVVNMRLIWVMAVVPLLGFWLYGLFDLDEGFYAAVVREMIFRNEWITPIYNGVPWFEKPILLYWLARPTVALFDGSFGARLPNVLCALATYLIVFRYTCRQLGQGSAALAVVVLSSGLLMVGSARMMLTDGPLLLTLTAAFMTFYESLSGRPSLRLWTAFWLGLSVLAKGPFGLLIFGLVAGWLYLKEPELRPRFKGYWLVGTLIMLTVVCIWYVPAYLANRSLFVEEFLIRQNIGRFKGGDEAHHVPGLLGYLFFVPVLLLGMIPWSGWVLKAWPKKESSSFERYLAAWAAVVFLFFSVSGTKLIHYVLPCVPPLSVLIGHYLARHKWAIAIRMGGFVVALAVLLANVLFYQVYNSVRPVTAEVHRLTAYVKARGGDLAVYRMSRIGADKGTGKPQIKETSHPSIVFYLGKPLASHDGQALATDDFDLLLRASKPLWIITRTHRIGDDELEQTRRNGHKLETIKELQDYALYRLSR